MNARPRFFLISCCRSVGEGRPGEFRFFKNRRPAWVAKAVGKSSCVRPGFLRPSHLRARSWSPRPGRGHNEFEIRRAGPENSCPPRPPERARERTSSAGMIPSSPSPTRRKQSRAVSRVGQPATLNAPEPLSRRCALPWGPGARIVQGPRPTTEWASRDLPSFFVLQDGRNADPFSTRPARPRPGGSRAPWPPGRPAPRPALDARRARAGVPLTERDEHSESSWIPRRRRRSHPRRGSRCSRAPRVPAASASSGPPIRPPGKFPRAQIAWYGAGRPRRADYVSWVVFSTVGDPKSNRRRPNPPLSLSCAPHPAFDGGRPRRPSQAPHPLQTFGLLTDAMSLDAHVEPNGAIEGRERARPSGGSPLVPGGPPPVPSAINPHAFAHALFSLGQQARPEGRVV